jgi:hypothetical protein
MPRVVDPVSVMGAIDMVVDEHNASLH